MAQVAVTIGGRVYRVACDEGEEDRLSELTRVIDAKIESMRQRFGEIGDQRLTIMAAIMIADELADTTRRIADLQTELAQLRGSFSQAASGRTEWAQRLAVSLEEAALRIERVAQDLNGAEREHP